MHHYDPPSKAVTIGSSRFPSRYDDKPTVNVVANFCWYKFLIGTREKISLSIHSYTVNGFVEISEGGWKCQRRSISFEKIDDGLISEQACTCGMKDARKEKSKYDLPRLA